MTRGPALGAQPLPDGPLPDGPLPDRPLPDRPGPGRASAQDDVEALDPLSVEGEPVVEVRRPAREVPLEVVADHPGLAVAIDLGDRGRVRELGPRLADEAAQRLGAAEGLADVGDHGPWSEEGERRVGIAGLLGLQEG